MRVRSLNTSYLPSWWPRMNTRPSEGKVRVASMPTAVDLPMPFGPNSTQRSPALMVRFTSVMMTRRLRRNSTLSSWRTVWDMILLSGTKRRESTAYCTVSPSVTLREPALSRFYFFCSSSTDW